LLTTRCEKQVIKDVPLNRGLPKFSIKYGKNGTVACIQYIASVFNNSAPTTVYHVVFDELLKESGHDLRIIV